MAPALVALLLASLFAGSLLVRYDGDASRFVWAGERFVDRAEAPDGLHVRSDEGYDGQFYYRLALDPSELATEAHGIRLDSGVRRDRIGYPTLAWLLSAGSEAALPWALIALNVAGLAVLAALGGLVARDAGRHELWGLLVAGFFGFLFVLARDLGEITAACGLLAGLVLYRRRRYLLSGAALALAVLSRESAGVAVLALLAVWLAGVVSERGRPWSAALAWVLPAAAFVAWQLVVRQDVGATPLFDTEAAVGAPFVGLVRHFPGWWTGRGQPGLAAPEFVLLVALVAITIASLRRSSARIHEKLAWGLSLVLVACLSGTVYTAPADFRTWTEVWVLGMLVLLSDPKRRLALPAIGAGAAWLAVAVFNVVV